MTEEEVLAQIQDVSSHPMFTELKAKHKLLSSQNESMGRRLDECLQRIDELTAQAETQFQDTIKA